MKQILEIDVKITDFCFVKGASEQINMLLFSGSCDGEFFKGKTICTGTDTQKCSQNEFVLSARYMLEGVDFTDARCKIFIENTGSEDKGFKPKIVTDSAALAEWEKAELTAEIISVTGGVTVKIFMEG